MSTTHDEHAGLRWIFPFIAIIAVTLAMTLAMMIYPHLTR